MLLLFTLGASAQPALYGNGPYFGAGPAPLYPPYGARQVVPQQVSYGQQVPSYGARQVAPQQVGLTQADWDLRQANKLVRSDEFDVQGNNLFYNTPIGVLFPNADPAVIDNTGLIRFGAYSKVRAVELDVERLEDEIAYYRRTHPEMTPEDRDHLNDLRLQLEASRNQKIRRSFQVLPTTGSFPAFFERRANQNDLDLAQNALYDARNDARADPSQDAAVDLRNARDDVEQTQARRDANTFDLLAASGGNLQIAPLLRRKASQAKLDVGRRNLRTAQQDFAEDPSETNRLKVRLARLYVDATEQEDDANVNEFLYSSNFNQFGLMNVILSSKNFQDEANLWLRYDRLSRKILLKEQAAQGKGADENPIAEQLMGLSMYGASSGGPRTGNQ